MILTESTSQPYALMVFALVGAAMGALYGIKYFAAEFLTKKRIFGYILDVAYVGVYAAVFASVEIRLFDYKLHAYHFAIAVFFTAALAGGMYLLIRRYRKNIELKCEKLKEKIRASKHYKRFTK